eukprot:scaffold2045_cov404-Prasinococcus_capsulatus_cf.AAC.33
MDPHGRGSIQPAVGAQRLLEPTPKPDPDCPAGRAERYGAAGVISICEDNAARAYRISPAGRPLPATAILPREQEERRAAPSTPPRRRPSRHRPRQRGAWRAGDGSRGRGCPDGG